MKSYSIPEIKLNLRDDLSQIPDAIRSKLHRRNLDIEEWHIVKESIDARDKGHIQRVYQVEFKTTTVLNLAEAVVQGYEFPDRDRITPPPHRPVVVGFGPCGIFAAFMLAKAGLRPLVLERGKSMENRDLDVLSFWKSGILDEESNVQFGEGGAGAYSDGKLTTGTRDLRNRLVLDTLVAAGADPEIKYKKRPHVGTDVLKDVVVSIRKQIESMGGEIRFQSKLTDVSFNNGSLAAIEVNGVEVIPVSDLILGIGHSARDTFRMLHRRGIVFEPKPFSMGVRMAHPQQMINRSQYGDEDLAEVLGPADYKLVHHCRNGRGLYSFCMCPGGMVIAAASERGGIVVNGMSYHARDGLYANSGILTDVRVEDYFINSPLDGIDFQRKVEVAAFAATGKENTSPQADWNSFQTDPDNILRKCLPDFVTESLLEGIPAFGKKIRGFDGPLAQLIGVETRSSSPVRIPRDAHLTSNIAGIYPGGEGAGHAGGIVSAAVDGVKLAETVIAGYPKT
jgi:hypothetical protein